jgi:hypothetical protein
MQTNIATTPITCRTTVQSICDRIESTIVSAMDCWLSSDLTPAVLRLFCCMNKQCKTTLVMPARYKVANCGIGEPRDIFNGERI